MNIYKRFIKFEDKIIAKIADWAFQEHVSRGAMNISFLICIINIVIIIIIIVAK